jgi:hypothetical protein
MSRTDRRADRELLVTLVDALSVSLGRLRRDPCGDWVINGTRGHILTDGTDAFVYLPAGTARRWERAKRTLNFMSPTQDGDTEGVLKLIEMPSSPLAAVLRKVIGLRKVSILTDEQRQLLARHSFGRDKPPVSRTIFDLPEVGATNRASTLQNAPARAAKGDAS